MILWKYRSWKWRQNHDLFKIDHGYDIIGKNVSVKMAEFPNFSIDFDDIIGDYDLVDLVDEMSQADEQNKQQEETGNPTKVT